MVDVAGGIGTKTMSLAREFGHLKYVVQDRSTVINEDASKVQSKLINIIRGLYLNASDMTVVLGQRVS